MQQEEPAVNLALTGGLSPGAKLRKNQLFTLKATGVEFSGEMTYEKWLDGMKLVKMAKNSLALWRADFVREGNRLFGKDRVNEAMVQLEFELHDARRAIAIASLDPSIRSSELDEHHYWVLARASKSGANAQRWAEVAIKHKLTANQLMQSIAAGRVVTTAERSRAIGRGSGIATPHGIRQSFELWRNQVGKEDPIARWDRKKKQALLEELGPMVKMVRDLEADLESGVEA